MSAVVIDASHRFGGLKLVPQLVQPLTTGPTDARLDKLVEKFVKAQRMGTTGADYRRDIMGSPVKDSDRALAYVEFLDQRDVSFFDASREDVDDWRHYLEKERGLAPATRARRLAAVSGLYTYGITENLLKENPAKHVKRPEVGDNIQYSGLSHIQVRKLLRASRSHAFQRVDRNWSRTSAIVHVLLYTGLRRNELACADADTLREERGHWLLDVVRKRGKRQRIVIPPEALGPLRSYLGSRRTGPLLLSEDGHRLDGSGVFRAVQRLGRHALPELTSLHPHDLRHSCATMMFEAGASDWRVQEVLGHADSRTTQRYMHAVLAFDESPQYLLGAMLNGASTDVART